MDLNTVNPPVKSESNEGNIRKKDCYSSKKWERKQKNEGKRDIDTQEKEKVKNMGKKLKGRRMKRGKEKIRKEKLDITINKREMRDGCLVKMGTSDNSKETLGMP